MSTTGEDEYDDASLHPEAPQPAEPGTPAPPPLPVPGPDAPHPEAPQPSSRGLTERSFCRPTRSWWRPAPSAASSAG